MNFEPGALLESFQFILGKMKIDPCLLAAGSNVGIDVEALLKKYSGGPQNSNSACVPASAQTPNVSNTDGLDHIRICIKCQGYGLVKEFYNHQVKEVTCGECEGEGILEMGKGSNAGSKLKDRET
mmetsp:Transcript_28684/g.60555  ORF Transcript_28684/g.60555 Transcript_28684/m.60555 type:complete len:125 (+) Transcript_28684:1022-1396(+)